jgi:hypothetical protein
MEEKSDVKASSTSSDHQQILSRKRAPCPASDESTSSAESSADAGAGKGSVDESLPRNGIVVSRKKNRSSSTSPIPHSISVQTEQRIEAKQADEVGSPKSSDLQRIKELQTKMRLSTQGWACVDVKQANGTKVVPIAQNLRCIKELQAKMQQIGKSSLSLQLSETSDSESLEASVDDEESNVDEGDIAEDESATESEKEAHESLHGSKMPLHASARIEGQSSVLQGSCDEREPTKVAPNAVDSGQTRKRQSGVFFFTAAGLYDHGKTREQMDQPRMVLTSPARQPSDVKCYRCRLNWHLIVPSSATVKTSDSRLIATPLLARDLDLQQMSHTQHPNAPGVKPGCSETTPSLLPPKKAGAVQAQEDKSKKPEVNPINFNGTKRRLPMTARIVDAVPKTDKNKTNEINKGDPHLSPRPRNEIGLKSNDTRMRPLGPDFVRPGEFDVICDRGKLALNHSGNVRLKSTIETKLAEYAKATSKTQKTFIVTLIIDSVRDANGGFVKFKNGEWFEVGDFLAREKVGQWYVVDCALLYLTDEILNWVC